MPKTTSQRFVFTLIGVIMMATVMATFNKYLVYGEWSAELWKQVGIAFCQKAPFAFLMQFFLVQPFASKKCREYPSDNPIVYRCIRVGFTVIIMCPAMCIYSNVINWFLFHWSFGQFLNAIVTKIPVNWIFATCVQIWFLKPLNTILFQAIYREREAKA